MKTRHTLLALCVAAALADASRADLLADLVTERGWIGYSPRNQNPNIGLQPSQASIRNDLVQLYDAGWRHLYNYSIDGVGQHVPRIAKEVGFENVLAGVFYFDGAQLAREKANAAVADPYTDGYIVGNEGLLFNRYGAADLIDAVEFFEGFGKPVTTTEVGGVYFNNPSLMDLGDFVTVNIQKWFDPTINPFDAAAIAQAVRNEYVALKSLRPDRLVVIKEAWWPSAGHPAATEEFQALFFNELANQTDADGDPLLFMWGESHDQPWKLEQSPFGQIGTHWGFYESDGDPKQIVSALAPTYTGRYPVNFTIGDFDRNGAVAAADYSAWADAYGDTVDIAGAASDANFDRAFNAADYTLWRQAFAANAAATVPEPAAAAMLAFAAAGLAATTRR